MPNHRRLLDALGLTFRPARWSILGFRFVPLLLLAAGVWAVAYGGFYHRIPVSETHTEQFTVEEPVALTMPPGTAPFSPGGGFGQSTDAFGQPTEPSEASGPADEPGPPEAFKLPFKLVQLEKTVTTLSQESELAVNRAVTVAGMIRDPQGQIVRQNGTGDGPAFCPT
jgi:hypothetical protein